MTGFHETRDGLRFYRAMQDNGERQAAALERVAAALESLAYPPGWQDSNLQKDVAEMATQTARLVAAVADVDATLRRINLALGGKS